MKRVLVLAIAACSRRDPIASCDDDLHGVYAAVAGDVAAATAGDVAAATAGDVAGDGNERWMVLDNGPTLEAYPLFPDGGGPDPEAATPAGVVVAPRVIDLARAPWGTPGAPGTSAAGTRPGADPQLPTMPGTLAGTLRRRYMRRQERCEAHVPVHLTRCAGDTLELVLADPSPPLAYAPCTWSRPGPSRLVRWRRE